MGTRRAFESFGSRAEFESHLSKRNDMAVILKPEPITYEWLRSRGFRLQSHHVDNQPHMVLVLPGRNETALEVCASYDGCWIVWLRSDLAGSRTRFCFLRHVKTDDQVERLYQGITDSPLLPVEWDPKQFAEGLERERQDCERRYQEYCRKERYGYIPGG
jgi:hypothetical protein